MVECDCRATSSTGPGSTTAHGGGSGIAGVACTFHILQCVLLLAILHDFEKSDEAQQDMVHVSRLRAIRPLHTHSVSVQYNFMLSLLEFDTAMHCCGLAPVGQRAMIGEEAYKLCHTVS